MQFTPIVYTLTWTKRAIWKVFQHNWHSNTWKFYMIKIKQVRHYIIIRIKYHMKYYVTFSWKDQIFIEAVDIWRGNTISYSVVECMYTSYLTICFQQYTTRPYGFSLSKFTHFIIHPIFPINQTTTHIHLFDEAFALSLVNASSYSVSHTCSLSHSHPLTPMNIRW